MRIPIIWLKAIICINMLWPNSITYAIDIPTQQYSVNEGLSQSLVTAVCQDNDGFLWIGTGDGLNRFDGIDFITYKYNPDNKYSISGNLIRGIIKDPYGNLWIGTESGLNYFNKKTGKFINSGSSNNHSVIIPFYADSSHVYYWDAYKNIVLLDFINKKYKVLKTSVNLYRPFLYNPSENILYAIDDENNLVEINLTTSLITTIHTFDKNILSINFNDKKLVITTSSTVYQIDPHIKNHPLEVLINSKEANKNSIFDNQGNLWLFKENSIEIYNRSFHIENIIKAAGAYNVNLQTYGKTTEVFCDNSGIVWLGTDGEGIYKLNYNNLKFKNHFNHIKNPKLLNTGFIKTFHEDDAGNLFIGTFRNGFSILSNKQEPLAKIDRLPWNNQYFTVTGFVRGRHKDEIFISTSKEIISYNINQNSLQKLDAVDLPLFTINAISKKVGSEEIIICTEEGLFSATVVNNQIIYNRLFNLRNRITSVHCTAEGGIFIFKNTIYQYFDRSGNQIDIIKDPKNILPAKISFKVLFEDKDFKWIGSNYGLIQLSKNFTVLKVFGINDGLPDLLIYGILKDERQNLWLSSNKGLSKFNLSTNTFKNYTIADGLQSYEFNSDAFLKKRSGEMVFGGINGFNIFNPDEIHDNEYQPQISLIKASIFDKEIEINQFTSATATPKFLWFNNTFNFELAALEFTQPYKNKIAFKLEGLDESWYFTQNKRNIRFTALPPGNYTLWAKASNNDETWSEPKLMASFNILKPFWQLWWFIIPVWTFVVLIIGGIIYLIISSRYKKRLLELERQREIGEIRNKISKDIHDDIGSGLTRIALLTELIKANTLNNDEEINKSLNKLSDHSRELATNLGEIVWTVNPVHDNLNSLLSYLRNYIAGFLEDADINYNINFPESMNEETINPEIRRSLFMIVKEALNNIVKHAQAKNVSVNLQIVNKWMIFDIEDDGKGIPEEKNRFGNGLINMHQRIDKLGGKILISQNIPIGTKIHLEVKIN